MNHISNGFNVLKTGPRKPKWGYFPKKLHLWVDMTHKGGPNPDHIGLASDPRYGKVNPQVWALQPHYSTFYCRNSVKKRCFFDLKTVFYFVVDFWVPISQDVGGGYTPYLDHMFPILWLTWGSIFRPGQWKANLRHFFISNFTRFLTFFGLFFNFDIFMT